MREKQEILDELQMYKLTANGMQHVTIVCAERLISEAYDNFKSRTCEICSHYKEDTMTCSKKGISVDSPRHIDFVGCGKWEVK